MPKGKVLLILTVVGVALTAYMVAIGELRAADILSLLPQN